MQLPDISHTNVSNVVRIADGARKTRVLYAGDMEFARAQFASVAPQLQLIPAAPAGGDGHATEPPDVALIDCGAPGVDPRATVEGIRARSLDIPIVLALDPAAAAENGATRMTADLRVDDYTVKLPGWLARLPARLEFAIAHHRRRRSLDALQLSAERLRTVVESAPVCLARVARDGTILAMNTAAMKMVSADAPEDVLGKSLLSLIPSGATESVRTFLDSVSAGQPGSLEFETTAAGSSRIVDARAVPLSPDADGRASALLVLRDATERKRLEDSVVAASSTVATDAHAAEHDRLERELEAALAECRRVEAERDALRGQAEEARARAATVDHVRDACSTAEQQLSRLQIDYERVSAERDALVEDLANTRLRHEASIAEQQAHQDSQRAQTDARDAERAQLASRCDALEALVRSLEAAQAAEREEHRAALAQAEAARGRAEQADLLVGEREALLNSLNTLRAQFDEMSTALDAEDARHAEALREHKAATAAVEARLRDSEHARLAIAVERDELRSALDAARATVAQLEASAQDSQLGRDARLANAEGTRDALQQRVKELDARVAVVTAERDELRGALDAARAAMERMEVAAREAQMGREAQLAAAESTRQALEQRVIELDARVRAAAAESDELRAGLDTAHATIERLEYAARDTRTGRDAHLAEAASSRAALEQQIAGLQGRVAVLAAERDAVREELDEAVRAAQARTQQLRAGLEEIRASRDAQAAHAEAVRRELTDRVEQLQVRLQAATVERDALHNEMRLALEAANGRSAQLEATVNALRGSDARAAADDEARRELAVRIEDLQSRLGAATADREAIERALDAARAEHESRLREATTEREALEARVAERDAENTRLAAQLAEMQQPADVSPAESAAAPGTTDLEDAQVAFREAVHLLSGELHTAVEATRAQHAALLFGQPTGYDAVVERLRQSEADCRRLSVERDERDATVHALQAELQQLLEFRREQRKELVRALQESEESERRAAARLAECVRLRQMLAEAQAMLQRLSKWASNQSGRLAAAPAQSRLGGAAEAAPGAPPEGSWS